MSTRNNNKLNVEFKMSTNKYHPKSRSLTFPETTSQDIAMRLASDCAPSPISQCSVSMQAAHDPVRTSTCFSMQCLH